MTVVIGTAGHIDHGKTTLLRALTGIDADRLPEERRRGLTIDVGYAHGSPDGGPEIDYVDVPGHDRLVGNMLVGVGEIDAALLVVAADDGPMAQTFEHLGLLHAMGIMRGLVAITKVDLVTETRRAEVASAVADLLSATSLAGAPVVPVSANSGAGLEALRTALAALRDDVERDGSRRSRPERAWVAIDRVFSVRGRGVVVTGSARGTPLVAGQSVRIEPGDLGARVRGIEVHDVEVMESPAGGRVALNLAGIAQRSLRRGLVVTSADGAHDPLAVVGSDRLLVVLDAPAALPGRRPDDAWPPPDGSTTRIHIGTDQAGAILGRSGRDAVTLPDGRALALLRLDRPVATAIGERFVLRRPRPAALLAGGIVLDPDPRARAIAAAPVRALPHPPRGGRGGGRSRCHPGRSHRAPRVPDLDLLGPSWPRTSRGMPPPRSWRPSRLEAGSVPERRACPSAPPAAPEARSSGGRCPSTGRRRTRQPPRCWPACSRTGGWSGAARPSTCRDVAPCLPIPLARRP